MIKDYGVEIVYDAVNEAYLEEGKEWYLQVKDMCDHLLEFQEEEVAKGIVEDILNAKKLGTNKME